MLFQIIAPLQEKKQRKRNTYTTKWDRKRSASASLNVWSDPLLETEEAGSDTSAESLDWDPIDGMHAEKQRTVRDLKKYWDVKSQEEPSQSKRKTQ